MGIKSLPSIPFHPSYFLVFRSSPPSPPPLHLFKQLNPTQTVSTLNNRHINAITIVLIGTYFHSLSVSISLLPRTPHPPPNHSSHCDDAKERQFNAEIDMYSRSGTLARVLNKYRISRKPLLQLSFSVSSWWHGGNGMAVVLEVVSEASQSEWELGILRDIRK